MRRKRLDCCPVARVGDRLPPEASRPCLVLRPGAAARRVSPSGTGRSEAGLEAWCRCGSSMRRMSLVQGVGRRPSSACRPRPREHRRVVRHLGLDELLRLRVRVRVEHLVRQRRVHLGPQDVVDELVRVAAGAARPSGSPSCRRTAAPPVFGISASIVAGRSWLSMRALAGDVDVARPAQRQRRASRWPCR